MNAKPYRVTVVVDLQYGKRLRDLPAGEPVWVVDSAQNHSEIEAIWRERQISHLDGLTSFTFDAHALPEDWLISQFSAIDLHHGKFSHTPPWSVLNVIGVGWSERIADELAQFGFTDHTDTALGFETTREK